MNTTLSAPSGTPSEQLTPQHAGHDQRSFDVPSGDALRRLPVLSRLKLRAALWLLERTPAVRTVPASGAVSSDAACSGIASSVHEQAAAGREARAAYEAMQTRRAAPPRTL